LRPFWAFRSLWALWTFWTTPSDAIADHDQTRLMNNDDVYSGVDNLNSRGLSGDGDNPFTALGYGYLIRTVSYMDIATAFSHYGSGSNAVALTDATSLSSTSA